MSEPWKAVSSVVTSTARSLVSRDKFRLKDDALGVDLDLTYITDRIIAMGLPCAKLDSLYRNHENDVAKYLNHKHKGNYMIFNLTKKKYSFSKFHHAVRVFSWPDHHAPTLELLCNLVLAMYDWLQENPKHVVVVHCLAGRGRTGTALCCLLYYINFCGSMSEAITYFARTRSKTGEGVVGPSQLRYCDYFQHVALNGIPEPKVVTLQAIELQPIPSFGLDRKFCPCFELCNPATPKIPFYSNVGTDELRYGAGDYSAKMFCSARFQGDILIRVLHQYLVPGASPSLLFRIQFHTSFINSSIVVFHMAELDAPQAGPISDSRFPSFFTVKLYFEEPNLLDNLNIPNAPAEPTQTPAQPTRPKSMFVPSSSANTTTEPPLGIVGHSVIGSPPRTRSSSKPLPVYTKRVPSYRHSFSPSKSTHPVIPHAEPTPQPLRHQAPTIAPHELSLEERMQNLFKPN